jgi:hypothetical protein
LTISEDLDLFANVPELEPTILLTEFLAVRAQVALKINPEEARSKMIIPPILLNSIKQVNTVQLTLSDEFNLTILWEIQASFRSQIALN